MDLREPHVTVTSLVRPSDAATATRDGDGVDIVVDGVLIGELQPSAEASVSYRPDLASLAQLPGSNFYHRIREKFGHLAV